MFTIFSFIEFITSRIQFCAYQYFLLFPVGMENWRNILELKIVITYDLVPVEISQIIFRISRSCL